MAEVDQRLVFEETLRSIIGLSIRMSAQIIMCYTVCPDEHANYRCVLTPLGLLCCPAGQINLRDTKPNDEKVQFKRVIRALEP